MRRRGAGGVRARGSALRCSSIARLHHFLHPCLQVVVLVTDDLRVICLDHNLAKKWERDLTVRAPRVQ